jgi:hypothetical protein
MKTVLILILFVVITLLVIVVTLPFYFLSSLWHGKWMQNKDLTYIEAIVEVVSLIIEGDE